MDGMMHGGMSRRRKVSCDCLPGEVIRGICLLVVSLSFIDSSSFVTMKVSVKVNIRYH